MPRTPAGPTRGRWTGPGLALLASFLALAAVLASQPAMAGQPGQAREVGQRSFVVNVTATGLDPTLDHEVVPSEFLELEPPNGTDRVVLTAAWADQGTGSPLRVEVFERGCLTVCRQEPLAVAEGVPPLGLDLDPGQRRSLHVHVTAGEDVHLKDRVEGMARFLALGPTETQVTGSQGVGSPDAAATPSSDPGPWRKRALGAGTAISLAAGLGWAIRRARQGAPLVGLFSRFGKDELLDHPLRRRIVEEVHRDPAIHQEELVRRLDLGRGQLEHHLAKLLEAGLLVEHEAAGYRAFFTPGQHPPKLREALVLLKTPGARRLLTVVVDAPGAGIREIAEQADLAPSTVSYHADRLQAVDLLTEEETTVKRVLSPTRLAEQVLSITDTRPA